jgi:hypothetical protein
VDQHVAPPPTLKKGRHFVNPSRRVASNRHSSRRVNICALATPYSVLTLHRTLITCRSHGLLRSPEYAASLSTVLSLPCSLNKFCTMPCAQFHSVSSIVSNSVPTGVLPRVLTETYTDPRRIFLPSIAHSRPGIPTSTAFSYRIVNLHLFNRGS